MLKLSILDPVQIPNGKTSADAMRCSIALARAAERLGYTRYWIVEHHGVPYEATPAPEVFAVALAQATQSLRIGIGGLLLNHHSPYKAAETLRTLNALFPGRIDVGIGRATAGPMADLALKRFRDAVVTDDHDQHVEELLGWLGNDLPRSSPFYGMALMPDTPAGPVPWILAVTEASALRAAHLGLPLACSAFHVPENAPLAMAAYQREFRPSHFAVGVPAPKTLLALRLIVGETTEEAERLAMPMRAAFKYRRKDGVMPTRLMTPDEAIAALGRLPAETQDWPAYVIGDRAHVKATVARMVAQTGAQEVMVQDVLHEQHLRIRNYEILAECFGLDRL